MSNEPEPARSGIYHGLRCRVSKYVPLDDETEGEWVAYKPVRDFRRMSALELEMDIARLERDIVKSEWRVKKMRRHQERRRQASGGGGGRRRWRKPAWLCWPKWMVGSAWLSSGGRFTVL